MGVKFSPVDGSGGFRYELILGCKAGKGMRFRKMPFAIVGLASAAADTQAIAISEKIDSWSIGQPVKLSKLMGAFVESEHIEEEPLGIQYGKVILEDTTGRRHARLSIPWLKKTVPLLDIEQWFIANLATLSLGHVRMAVDPSTGESTFDSRPTVVFKGLSVHQYSGKKDHDLVTNEDVEGQD